MHKQSEKFGYGVQVCRRRDCTLAQVLKASLNISLNMTNMVSLQQDFHTCTRGLYLRLSSKTGCQTANLMQIIYLPTPP